MKNTLQTTTTSKKGRGCYNRNLRLFDSSLGIPNRELSQRSSSCTESDYRVFILDIIDKVEKIMMEVESGPLLEDVCPLEIGTDNPGESKGAIPQCFSSVQRPEPKQ
jgi:hypothetical protein